MPSRAAARYAGASGPPELRWRPLGSCGDQEVAQQVRLHGHARRHELRVAHAEVDELERVVHEVVELPHVRVAAELAAMDLPARAVDLADEADLFVVVGRQAVGLVDLYERHGAPTDPARVGQPPGRTRPHSAWDARAGEAGELRDRRVEIDHVDEPGVLGADQGQVLVRVEDQGGNPTINGTRTPAS